MRSRLIRVVLGLAVIGALAGGGVAWATAGDDEETVTGPAADRAASAALERVGSGRVTAVERESEDGATWEVEVVRADGSSVDVLLDAAYRVVAVEGDTESGPDDDADGE